MEARVLKAVRARHLLGPRKGAKLQGMDHHWRLKLTLQVVSQALRVVNDSDKFNDENFIKNWVKKFTRGVDPIKAKNCINNKETTFKAMQVHHRHKTTLETTMLQEEAYHW